MSRWIDIPKEDIEIDGNEVNFFVTSDDYGSIYAVVKLKDLIEKLTTQPKDN